MDENTSTNKVDTLSNNLKTIKTIKTRKKRKTKDEILKENKNKALEEPIIVVKKKRGRKKKIKTEEEIEREKNKPKQRRGRKPKSLINNINSKNSQLLIDSCNNKNNDTIILNLKIETLKNVPNNNLNNIPNYETLNNSNTLDLPTGYDINDNNFSSTPSNINNKKIVDINKTEIIELPIQDIPNINNNTKQENNYNLEEIIIPDKNNEWSMNTKKACYWCCHSFNNNSFGIPIKFKNDKFYVYGCFCSLECAAAYNFSEERNIQDIWESYNLINFLSHVIKYKNIVKLAPNRICLTMFGGNMTIEEFRSFTESNKITNTLEYPMIPVSQQIEEINYDNTYNKNDYIPIDEDRVRKLEQKIKLMRTTPLLNHKNTLEHTMNIKINQT